MRPLLLAAAFLFSFVSSSAFAGAVFVVDPNGTNPDAALHSAVTQAAAGDTIQILAGTINVASTITVNKAITIKGATTTCTSEPSSSVTANTTYDPADSDCTHNGGTLAPGTSNGGTVLEYMATNSLFKIDVKDAPNIPVLRISGLTFHDALSSPNGNLISVAATSTVKKFRMDHLHWKQSPFGTYLEVLGSTRGVIDHCIAEFGSQHIFEIRNGGDGGADVWGHTSWAQPTAWGSNDFLFLEHNWLDNPTNASQGGVNMVNGERGRKLVMRHNYVDNGKVGCHGTENGAMRGMRADEYYRNHINWQNTSVEQRWSSRNGDVMLWGNRYTLTSGTPQKKGFHPEAYRLNTNPGVNKLGWWGSAGTSPWDVNDTDGGCSEIALATNGLANVCGSYAAGSASHQYYPPIGTATVAATDGTFSSGRGVLVDLAAAFITGHWINFGIVREADTETDRVTGIKNSHTIGTPGATQTISYGPTWAAGDQYRIFHVLVSLDQMGRGQGELIAGDGTATKPTKNIVTGVQSWPKEILEPDYSFDNDGGDIVMFNNDFLWQANRDFFNGGASSTVINGRQETGVGMGTLAQRPANCKTGPGDIAHVTTNNPGVGYWATDVASNNGSSDSGTLYQCSGSTASADGIWSPYYQPYTYPHPLTTGANPTPTPTPSASPTPSPTATPTPTPSSTPEPTATPTPSPTATPTPEPTATPSPTPEPTPSPSPTPTPTPEPTPSPSPSATVEPSPSPTATPSPTPTADPSPTATPTATPSPTATPEPSPSPTPAPSPTVTPTPEPSISPSPSSTPTPAINKAPIAKAGADQIVRMPNAITIIGSCSDDGLPVPPGKCSFQWSKVSGPGTVTFGSPLSLTTTAKFSIKGIYVLKLTVSDGKLSASDKMTATVRRRLTTRAATRVEQTGLKN